ncbi:MAG: glycoside hydrolase family 15 protein [Candidatus Dormibacteraeota bacterium]|nr:glycoside hydrolase family 15 protein [Candidatus Dormibacteraeota bacterium]
MSDQGAYPPIGDYGLISDGRSAALVSRQASIDWCCMPRLDSGSCFGRLLDWERGGCCSIQPDGAGFSSFRSYIEGTMALSTTIASAGGEARIVDCFTIPHGRPDSASPRLLRVIEGMRGLVRLTLRISPRFDYGQVRPWLRYHGRKLHTAVGGHDGLLIATDLELDRVSRHDLEASFTVAAQERIRLSIQYVAPSDAGSESPARPSPDELDGELEDTLEWWRSWSAQIQMGGRYRPGVVRSALALKALANPRTGAMAAAATTSLPEAPGGSRNWDYRFSWVRDSVFSIRSLSAVGAFEEAGAFRRFIEISAAGAADDLQIMYGMGGERRLTEIELPLEGYRGARPVRIGNAAFEQRQLDVYGELVELTWRWHEQGHSPDDDYWRFLVDLVDAAVERWREPDRGLWESRGKPQHYVHSKVMLWSAVEKGLRLAEACLRQAPVARWRKARDEIRHAVEHEGYDQKRNTFVRTFGGKDLDASLLLLPAVGFVPYDDPRMVGTVNAVREELDEGGLILRYRTEDSGDGLEGREGAFLACTFWLAECLARQGRLEEARRAFDRAASTGNDLGLFSEEFDTEHQEMLGNLPQALTHLSHIAAAVALQSLSSGEGAGSGEAAS